MKPEWRERVQMRIDSGEIIRRPDECACVSSDYLPCNGNRDIPDSPMCETCHGNDHDSTDRYGIFPITKEEVVRYEKECWQGSSQARGAEATNDTASS
jgi:hypothetical protein